MKSEAQQLRELIHEAYGHLGAAKAQLLPTDDPVIAADVIAAEAILGLAWKVEREQPEGDGASKRADDLQARLSVNESAVCHVLNRVQTDPEFRWHMLHTESFDRLVKAEAASSGSSEVEVRRRREADLQPEYRKRRPECAVNRDRVRELEMLLDNNGIEVPGRG